jgi:chemotaxis protein CheC
VSTPYTELQLDTLREVANIGSGTASTALSQLLARPVDISVPEARAVSLAEAVDSVGAADLEVSGVVLPVVGDLPSGVLCVFRTDDRDKLCQLLGVEPGSEVGQSALGEVANILGTHYLSSMHAMTGLALEPAPPQVMDDMLGAIVASVLVEHCGDDDLTLFIDSELFIEGESCSLSFLYVPGEAGATHLLTCLGMA